MQLVKVLYSKLPINIKEFQTFPVKVLREANSNLRGGRRVCYHCAIVAPRCLIKVSLKETVK